MNNEYTVAPNTTLQSLKEEARKEIQKHPAWKRLTPSEQENFYFFSDILIEKAFTAGKEEAVSILERRFLIIPDEDEDSKLEFSMTIRDWRRVFKAARTNNSLD